MDLLYSFLGIFPVLFSLLPIFLIIFGVVLIVLCFYKKVKIKWKTFKGKGFRPKRGPFGLYCYCGKQGTGKTYSLVEYLIDNNNKIQVFSNITGINNVDNITYFQGFNELKELKDKIDMAEYFKRDWIIFHNKKIQLQKNKQLIFVYDEVFTELQKGSRIGKDIIDFLCQMRKRQIIFLTTCQEWAELPLTWRRFCRFQIDCKMIPFLKTGFLLKTFKDAENMKWSNDEQEHIAPLVETTITKCRQFIAKSYDTRLRISSVQYAPTEELSFSSVGADDVQVSGVVS